MKNNFDNDFECVIFCDEIFDEIFDKKEIVEDVFDLPIDGEDGDSYNSIFKMMYPNGFEDD